MHVPSVRIRMGDTDEESSNIHLVPFSADKMTFYNTDTIKKKALTSIKQTYIKKSRDELPLLSSSRDFQLIGNGFYGISALT